MTPGFIDSHVHLGETLSRAVFPDNLPTMDWVFNWAKPFYAHTDARDELVGSMLAMAEMLRCGTTCFLDMGAHNDVAGVVGAIDRIGMRGVTGRHAADVRPASPPRGWSEEMLAHHYFADAKTALKALERVVREFDRAADGRVRAWVNIEGKEPSSSLELHVGARTLAEKLGVGTTYHLATSIQETRAIEEKFGIDAGAANRGPRRPGRQPRDRPRRRRHARGHRAHGRGAHQGRVLPRSVGQARQGRHAHRQVPGDAQSGHARRDRHRRRFCGRQSELDAADVSSRRHVQGRAHGLDVLGAGKALRMATIEAAEILGWDDEIGSIEPGKRADFVLFDLDHFEWVPYGDPLQARGVLGEPGVNRADLG